MTIPPFRPGPRDRVPGPGRPTPPLTTEIITGPAQPSRPAPPGDPDREIVIQAPAALAPVAPRQPLAPTTGIASALSALYMTLGLLVVIAALVAATPVIGAAWRWPVLVAAGVMLLLLDQLLRLVVRRASTMVVRVALVLNLLLFVVFAVGVSQSLVINGHVYLATSPTAKALHDSTSVSTAVNQLLAGDQLLTLSPAAARARTTDFQTAIATATAINAQYMNSKADPAVYQPVYTALGNAAYWEEQALTAAQNNLTQSGSNQVGAEAAAQQKFTTDIASTIQQNTTTAAAFGLSLPAVRGR